MINVYEEYYMHYKYMLHIFLSQITWDMELQKR